MIGWSGKEFAMIVLEEKGEEDNEDDEDIEGA
jgi:hypothetical protein